MYVVNYAAVNYMIIIHWKIIVMLIIYSQNGSSVPAKGEWMSSLSQIWFHYLFQ